MKYVLIALVTGLLVSLGAVVQPAQAARVTSACASGHALGLNIAAAAKVRVPAGKKSRPAGARAAQALAATIVPEMASPCSGPADPSVDDLFAAARQDIADGNTEQARAYIADTIDALRYVSNRAGRPQDMRTATPCEGFEDHHLEIPQDAIDALNIAQQAQQLGWDDLSDSAFTRATEIMEAWAKDGAGGQASSMPDWLSIAQALALVGDEGKVYQETFAKAQAVAQESFAGANRSSCRTTRESSDCFFKAAMAVSLLGAEPAGYERAVENGLKAAVALANGSKDAKKVRCPLEKYVFRMKFTTSNPAFGSSTFDTGRVEFEVRNGRITSPDTGPLVYSGGLGLCFEKKDENWVEIGRGTIKGGSWPYRVGGTDLVDSFMLQLKQHGKVSGSFSGNPLCQGAGEWMVGGVNSMLDQLNSPGWELPAGAWNYEDMRVEYETYEPTNTVTTNTTEFEFKQTYPRR